MVAGNELRQRAVGIIDPYREVDGAGDDRDRFPILKPEQLEDHRLVPADGLNFVRGQPIHRAETELVPVRLKLDPAGRVF